MRLTTNPAERLDFSASEWKNFREMHQQLLGIYLDFFRSSHHPSATEDLGSIAQQRNIPRRLLELGIHSFLDIARRQLPESLEHMLSYINHAFKSLQTLLEGVSMYQDFWLEGTRQLAWYMLFKITESRFWLILDPRYKTSFQVTDYDWHSESEIFQYRNVAAVTQKSSLQNASKTASYTSVEQQLIQTREGDRLKLLPNEILGETFSQLSRKDLLVCRFLVETIKLLLTRCPCIAIFGNGRSGFVFSPGKTSLKIANGSQSSSNWPGGKSDRKVGRSSSRWLNGNGLVSIFYRKM